jgi:hypothetical protein
MEYKLDEFGNLINDSGTAKNIFDLASESKIFSSTSSMTHTLSVTSLFRERRKLK